MARHSVVMVANRTVQIELQTVIPRIAAVIKQTKKSPISLPLAGVRRLSDFALHAVNYCAETARTTARAITHHFC
jgi:hypothetical protein